MPTYYWFKSLAATIVTDTEGQLQSRTESADPAEIAHKRGVSGEELAPLPRGKFRLALQHLRTPESLQQLRTQNIVRTKQDIRASYTPETSVIQAFRCIEDLTKITDMLSQRLREWYEYFNPEFSASIQDHERFISLVRDKSREELLESLGVPEEESMGASPSEEDREAIGHLADRISGLYEEKSRLTQYAEKKMQNVCPNVLAITGTMIGARVLNHAGSLKQLAEMPASTIQLLGAEKALFRHMTKGAKSPKYGFLYNHPLVLRQKPTLRGKTARAVADKISIAARVDLYEGEYIGDQLKEKLTKRFGGDST